MAYNFNKSTANQVTVTASTLSTPTVFIAPGSIASTTTNAAGTNFLMPTTTSTAGQLQVNGTRFLHAYSTDNTFVGSGSGNFTMTGPSQMVCVGAGAGASLSLGTGNGTYIGYNAGTLIAAGDSDTIVGYNGMGTFTGAT